jgi:hypothetical protein
LFLETDATKKATENCVFFSATGFFRSASKMATAAAIIVVSDIDIWF